MKPLRLPPACVSKSEKNLRFLSQRRFPVSPNCLEAIGERAGAVGSLPAVTTCVRLVGLRALRSPSPRRAIATASALLEMSRMLYNMQAGLGHHPLVP